MTTNWIRTALMSAMLTALCLVAPAAGALEEGCAAGPRPAATLLIPYFEVDFNEPQGRTTLLAVGNAGSAPALAHVVLWTDWGIPTLAFDIYLAADDIQTLNLRDVFEGRLPVTGGEGFDSCSNPVANPVLGPVERARLRQRHTGEPDGDGLCSGSGRAGVGVVTGYLTVDAMNGCSEVVRYPFEEGYFLDGGEGRASNANVLHGDVFLVDAGQDFAQGMAAVHIAADAARFGGEGPVPNTFYLVHGGSLGRDNRAPLGTRWRARYLRGGGFAGGTDLVIWAEPSLPVREPSPCGERASFLDFCQYMTLAPFDEDAGAGVETVRQPMTETAFKLFVGGPELPVDAPFGFVDVANRVLAACVLIPIGDFPLQSWVQPLYMASGRFSVGLEAIRTGDELCAPAGE